MEYKNNNTELKTRINQYVSTLDNNSIELDNELWEISELDIETNEYKCTRNRDIKYLKVDIVLKIQLEQTIENINNNFITHKEFHNSIGKLYQLKENSFSILNFEKNKELRYYIYQHGVLVLKIYEFNTELNFNIKFNKDKNFDVSGTDVTEYTNIPYSVNDIFNSFVDIIKSKIKGDIWYKYDIFYTDEYLFTPFHKKENGIIMFGFNIIPRKTDDMFSEYNENSIVYQQYKGEPIHIKPEGGLTLISFSDMMQIMLKQLDKNTLNLLDDKFILENY